MHVLSLGPEAEADFETFYVFLLPEREEIHARLDSVSTVGGTPLNETLREYARIRQTERETSDAMIRFIVENSANKAGRFAFCHCRQRWTEEQMNRILSGVDESFRSDEKVVLCLRSREIIKSLKKGAVIRVQKVGTKYTDFERLTPGGEACRLSEYLGRTEYLLIDFWASWCRPCIAGMPFIREQYEKYKDRGLTVIALAVDRAESRDAWLWTLENRIDMSWDQLGTPDEATLAALREAFVVEDIPYAVIIDRQGTMVGMLRMPELTLAEAPEGLFR